MTRKRRGRGEGAIYQRGDGKWCASVSAGLRPDGKRRRRVLYGETKGAVQEKLRNLKNDVADGKPIEVSKLTVAQYLEHWLSRSQSSVAPETHRRYKTVVAHQLKPFMGSMKLAAVQPLHVEQLYLDLNKAGCSARAQQLAGVTLGRALKQAVILKLIASNPCRDIPKPRVAKREMKTWDARVVGKFLKTAKRDRLHAMYAVALGGGLRQGELFGLQWADVDFKQSTIVVRRALEEIRGAFRLKEPKIGIGRKVDLPRFAMDALKSHRAAMLAEGNIAAQVFCATDGGYLRKSNVVRRSFALVIKNAKVPTIRFHDLRHTSATLLLLAGENVKVVSERLGHSSIKITLDTYAHVLPTMQKAAAAKMQKLLG